MITDDGIITFRGRIAGVRVRRDDGTAWAIDARVANELAWGES